MDRGLVYATLLCVASMVLGGVITLGIYTTEHTCEAGHSPPWSIEEIQRYAGTEEDGMLGPDTTRKYRARREKELFNKYGIEQHEKSLGEKENE